MLNPTSATTPRSESRWYQSTTNGKTMYVFFTARDFRGRTTSQDKRTASAISVSVHSICQSHRKDLAVGAEASLDLARRGLEVTRLVLLSRRCCKFAVPR